MTAPDPTAGEGKFERQSRRSGERLANLQPGSFTMTRPLVSPASVSPPAVAASTGTSEDVEALAKVILAERLAARELPNTYMDDAELVEAMKPRARAVLASDWLAAREAAARAEERERTLREFRRLAVRCYPKGMVPTSQVIADLDERIAREVRP